MAPEVLRFYEHVLVDEFQDTNMLQYEIAQKMAHKGNFFVVGDPDQSIYTWRNANVGYLNKRMREDYAGQISVHHLEVNYRSTMSIVKTSQLLITQDPQREKRQLTTGNVRGAPVCIAGFPDATTEATFISKEITRSNPPPSFFFFFFFSSAP